MNTAIDIQITSATYLSGHKLLIVFSDGVKRTVDFFPFLNDTQKQANLKYRKISNFRNFKIENGNIVWGKDWDMIFPVDQLYEQSAI